MYELILGQMEDVLPERVAPGSIDLLVTSPPYGLSMDYEQGDIAPHHYWAFTQGWIAVAFDCLKGGGYACVNIPIATQSFGSAFYPKFYTIAMMTGFVDAGVSICWQKRFADSGRLLRRKLRQKRYKGRMKFAFCEERVLVLQKPGLYQQNVGKDLTDAEMERWNNSVWEIEPEANHRDTHPAPFPIELPHRLIKIFSNPRDTVLDPFIGTGSTMVAAKRLGRFCVGVDCSETYLEYAKQRVKASRPNVDVLAGTSPPLEGGHGCTIA